MSEQLVKELNKHEQRIQKLEEIQQENKQHFKSIDETLVEHTMLLNSMHRTMLIIEDAVVNKIPALFDGYRMHQEQQEIIKERLDTLEEKSEIHSIRLTSLEITSKQNSEKLAKLSS